MDWTVCSCIDGNLLNTNLSAVGRDCPAAADAICRDNASTLTPRTATILITLFLLGIVSMINNLNLTNMESLDVTQFS